MAKYNRRNSTGYGLGTPLPLLYNRPVEANRVPANTDTGYDIGQVWIDTTTNQAWFLTSVVAGVATWALASPGASDVDTLTGDAGGPISPAGGNITLAGGTNIGSTGAGNTITFNLDPAITLATSVTSPIYTSAAAMAINAPAGNNITMRMGDAAGANLVRFTDSANALVASIDSNGTATFVGMDGILGAVTPAAATATTVTANTSVTSPLYTANAADALIQAGGVNDVVVRLGDAAGATFFRVQSSTPADVWTVDSTGAVGAFAGLTVTGAFAQTAGTFNVGQDNAANAINIGAGNVARAITIGAGAGAHTVNIGSAAAGAIAIDTAAGISLDSATASNFTVTGIADLTLQSVGGSLVLDGSEAAVDAISLNASNAAGGVTIAAGTGGLLFGNQADCTTIDLGNFAPTANRTITIGGGTVITAATTDTIDVGPDGATTNANSVKTVNVNTGGVTLGQVLTNIATGAVTSGTHTTSIATGNRAAGAMTVDVLTGTGTKTYNLGNVDGLTTVNIDAITLINDSVNVQTSINTGTSTGAVVIGNALAGAMSIDTGAGISLDGATASNFTVTGAAQDLTLASVGGSVNVAASEAAIDAITINASAGGVDITAATNDIDIVATLASVNITANEDAADAVVITSAAGGIDIAATGAAGQDIDITNTGGSVNITATEAIANAMVLTSSAGGIDITAVGGAGLDIDISNTGGSVNVTATENIASAVVITASGAASGMSLDAGTAGLTIGTGLILPVFEVTHAMTPYNALGTDYFLTTDTTGGVLQINLPAAPETGRTYVIYDGRGQAAIGGNITVNGNGNNIAAAGVSAATFVINTAYESISLTFNGLVWCGRDVV